MVVPSETSCRNSHRSMRPCLGVERRIDVLSERRCAPLSSCNSNTETEREREREKAQRQKVCRCVLVTLVTLAHCPSLSAFLWPNIRTHPTRPTSLPAICPLSAAPKSQQGRSYVRRVCFRHELVYVSGRGVLSVVVATKTVVVRGGRLATDWPVVQTEGQQRESKVAGANSEAAEKSAERPTWMRLCVTPWAAHSDLSRREGVV